MNKGFRYVKSSALIHSGFQNMFCQILNKRNAAFPTHIHCALHWLHSIGDVMLRNVVTVTKRRYFYQNWENWRTRPCFVHHPTSTLTLRGILLERTRVGNSLHLQIAHFSDTCFPQRSITEIVWNQRGNIPQRQRQLTRSSIASQSQLRNPYPHKYIRDIKLHADGDGVDQQSDTNQTSSIASLLRVTCFVHRTRSPVLRCFSEWRIRSMRDGGSQFR